MKFIARIAFAALLAYCGNNPAKAGVLYWDFSFTGSGVAGSGELITDDTADPTGPYAGALDILSVEGSVNGDAITGLLGQSGGPVATSPDGAFYYDNDFYAAGSASAAGGYFDDDGLLFTTAESSYNLFFDGNAYWDWADGGSGVVVSFEAVDPPAPDVPEPSSGLVLATALAGLLIVIRRKERRRA